MGRSGCSVCIQQSRAYNVRVLAYAPVAQLDRATGFEPVGRGFESLRAHHINPLQLIDPSHSHLGGFRLAFVIVPKSVPTLCTSGLFHRIQDRAWLRVNVAPGDGHIAVRLNVTASKGPYAVPSGLRRVLEYRK